LVGRKLKLEKKAAFDPFRRPIIVKKELLPFSEIASMVDIPSDPGKIICRCEQVRESEIVDALHRGIDVPTVDGVKRRTRAGMGYCQGGFCRPRVAEVMERELGVPIDPRDDVAHSGLNRVSRADIGGLLGQE
jgi:glycerol-3-phosphate dehydrogenase